MAVATYVPVCYRGLAPRRNKRPRIWRAMMQRAKGGSVLASLDPRYELYQSQHFQSNKINNIGTVGDKTLDPVVYARNRKRGASAGGQGL